MAKLIVNAPTGKQELIEVEESGGYFDQSLIVWDERKDGPIPANFSADVGGLVRDASGNLFKDAIREKQTADVIKAEQEAETKLAADIAARKAIVLNVNKAQTLDEIKLVVAELARAAGFEVE